MSFIILDRDGVINYDSEEYIKSPDEWIPIPGSLAAIAELNRAGFKVFIVTNQSGIARGLFTPDTLNAIHAKFNAAVTAAGGAIEYIFFCPHHPDDGCECRKPKIGLLQQIQQQYPIEFRTTYFIGDSHTDMVAAHAAGCKPLLVRTGKGAHTIHHHPEYSTVPHFDDLAQAVQFILAQKEHE